MSAPSPSPLPLTRPTQVSSFCVHIIDFLKNLDVRLRVVNSMGLALAHCSAHQSSYMAIMSPVEWLFSPPSLEAGMQLVICLLSLHPGHPETCHPGQAQG